mmetsp:Transcript_15930/g.22692  ORF Transcript_15930/g.22692 Transcript_15930/m.22692 type:complete len:263 (+) Transcript_15930:88-876(+)
MRRSHQNRHFAKKASKYAFPSMLLCSSKSILKVSLFLLTVVFVIRQSRKRDLLISKSEQQQRRASIGMTLSSNLRLQHHDELPLLKYQSLSIAFKHAEVIALYFAASWCSMSTPVSDKIESCFGPDTEIAKERVLNIEKVKSDESSSFKKKDLAIVYVSSDSNVEEQMEYSRSNWIDVPFDSLERSNLKRHFRVCAKIEIDKLHINRKAEIPSLIIIDSLTHKTLTMNGKSDVLSRGRSALDYWIQLKDELRASEDEEISIT